MDHNICKISSSATVNQTMPLGMESLKTTVEVVPLRVITVEINLEKVEDVRNLHGRSAVSAVKDSVLLQFKRELDLIFLSQGCAPEFPA